MQNRATDQTAKQGYRSGKSGKTGVQINSPRWENKGTDHLSEIDLRSGFWRKNRGTDQASKIDLRSRFCMKNRGTDQSSIYPSILRPLKFSLYLRKNWSVPLFSPPGKLICTPIFPRFPWSVPLIWYLICTPVLWIDLYPCFPVGEESASPPIRQNILPSLPQPVLAYEREARYIFKSFQTCQQKVK